VQVGLVDVYANHGLLVIGAEVEPDPEVALQGAAAVSSSHVLLATRGQAGLVRVRLWSGVGPLIGTEVVAAHLELPSQYLFNYDLERLGLHSFMLERIRTAMAHPSQLHRTQPRDRHVLEGRGRAFREFDSRF
jgi:hypothetical protein